MGQIRKFRAVLHLDDAFTSVAESVAARYGVSIQFLVEALLLGCLDASEEEALRPTIEAAPIKKESPKPKRRWRRATGPAQVVSLRAERARRGRVDTDTRRLRACAESVRAAARAARERARAVCERARQARRRGQEVVERTDARHAWA